MDTWADYGISAVRYDEGVQFISEIRVHRDTGTFMESGAEWSSTDVISKIDNKRPFVTLVEGGSGKWKKGQDVHIFTLDNQRFLRTDVNERANGNLENLPRF